ncbi:MAG: glutathione S-transferase family protein [Acetobacteraceae bacterium]
MQPTKPPSVGTLHWSPRSPYVRKVMIVAHEVGLADGIATVRTVVGGTTPHRGLMERAPLGKIPVLELPDGTVLYDSPVICDYLDSMQDGTKLFPPAWPARGVALRRLALGDGMVDVALAWLGERFRPADRQSAPHMALWREKLAACVAALEGESRVLAADPFTIGHIGIGVALGYLDFRFAELAWRDGHPALAAWYEGFTLRESVRNSPQVDER